MSIYEHFRPDEEVFVDKVLEWKQAAEEYHQVKLTDFLDPRQQQIATMVIGNQGMLLCSFMVLRQKRKEKELLFILIILS